MPMWVESQEEGMVTNRPGKEHLLEKNMKSWVRQGQKCVYRLDHFQWSVKGEIALETRLTGEEVETLYRKLFFFFLFSVALTGHREMGM